MNRVIRMCAIAMTTVVAASAAAQPCPNDGGQRAAVEGYLTAMQEHRFDDAYDFVTNNMTDLRERADWASMQKRFYEGGEVNIYGMDIRAARTAEGASACDERAVVPNILRSRDRYNTQGVVEFEIYDVVYDGTAWRVDAQQTIFEEREIGDFFPDVELVDAGTVP